MFNLNYEKKKVTKQKDLTGDTGGEKEQQNKQEFQVKTTMKWCLFKKMEPQYPEGHGRKKTETENLKLETDSHLDFTLKSISMKEIWK